MLMKEISYTDYNGVERKEKFYFNLSKPELVEILIELNISDEEDLEKVFERLLNSEDKRDLLALFKRLTAGAVGTKSEDGKRFIKTEKFTEEFMQTNAYSEFYMELITDSDAGAAFINGVVPPDMADAVSADELKAKVASKFIKSSGDPTTMSTAELAAQASTEGNA